MEDGLAVALARARLEAGLAVVAVSREGALAKVAEGGVAVRAVERAVAEAEEEAMAVMMVVEMEADLGVVPTGAPREAEAAACVEVRGLEGVAVAVKAAADAQEGLAVVERAEEVLAQLTFLH